MPANLQVNLDITDQPCLVIGGAAEAEEKTGRLLEERAAVTLLSPTLTRTLQVWALERKITHIPRDYEPGDEDGMRLVLLCIQNAYYGEELFAACKEKGIWMAAWDQPKIANFNFPALIRSGPVRLAVSTGGSSPGLASAIRKLLEKVFDERFGRYAEWVSERRQAVGELPAEHRFNAYKSLTDGLDLEAKITLPTAWEKIDGQ